MIKAIVYLMCILGLIVFGFTFIGRDFLPTWLTKYELLLTCSLTGGLGGVLYCTRAVYLNKCIKQEWNESWETWYYLRPIVSVISGAASYIFLKAGLLVLEAQEIETSKNFGFIALSFIAGLNVDNFVRKIESIAESAWGIGKSRSSKEDQL